jgi:hypothetical protein
MRLQERAVKPERGFINICVNLSLGTYRLTAFVVNNKQHPTFPTLSLHPTRFNNTFKSIIKKGVYIRDHVREKVEQQSFCKKMGNVL